MSTITVSGRKKLISPSRTLTGMKRMVSRISLVAVRTSRVTARGVEERGGGEIPGELLVQVAGGRPCGDVVDGRVPDGVDGHLIALPAGPGHEVGELCPVDIDHAAGVLQAQLGRVGLAHVSAGRAHGAVGDDLERPLCEHGGGWGSLAGPALRPATTPQFPPSS